MVQKCSSLIIALFCFLIFTGCNHSDSGKFYSNKILNSERIQMKYGSYGIDILRKDSLLRISNLYSIHQNEKITRTFAIVIYPNTKDSAFQKEHQSILKGGSIGKVFKENGWEIHKEPLFYGNIEEMAEDSYVYELMGNIASTKMAVFIYDFYITKESQKFKYVTILEVYHPDYLTLKSLKRIYPNLEDYTSMSPYIQSYLSTAKMKMITAP